MPFLHGGGKDVPQINDRPTRTKPSVFRNILTSGNWGITGAGGWGTRDIYYEMPENV